MSILTDIKAHKLREVAEQKAQVSLAELERHPHFARQTLSLSAALRADAWGIIAEFKRRSPSQGDIQMGAAVAPVLAGYAQNGAAAISVLSDARYFGGSLADVAAARAAVALPILRKEFIVDAYQIAEAKAAGADAILLIAAMIGPEEARAFTEVAHGLGLEVLLEIHSAEELRSHYHPSVDIVGINNRDLHSFRTDIGLSERLLPLLPAEALKISESGLRELADLQRLRALGFDGFLIGTQFMQHGRLF